jgi:hypothetical protein
MLPIPFLVAVIWALLVSTMILTPYWFFRSRQKRRKKEDNTQPTLPHIQEKAASRPTLDGEAKR